MEHVLLHAGLRAAETLPTILGLTALGAGIVIFLMIKAWDEETDKKKKQAGLIGVVVVAVVAVGFVGWAYQVAKTQCEGTTLTFTDQLKCSEAGLGPSPLEQPASLSLP